MPEAAPVTMATGGSEVEAIAGGLFGLGCGVELDVKAAWRYGRAKGQETWKVVMPCYRSIL